MLLVVTNGGQFGFKAGFEVWHISAFLKGADCDLNLIFRADMDLIFWICVRLWWWQACMATQIHKWNVSVTLTLQCRSLGHKTLSLWATVTETGNCLYKLYKLTRKYCLLEWSLTIVSKPMNESTRRPSVIKWVCRGAKDIHIGRSFHFKVMVNKWKLRFLCYSSQWPCRSEIFRWRLCNGVKHLQQQIESMVSKRKAWGPKMGIFLQSSQNIIVWTTISLSHRWILGIRKGLKGTHTGNTMGTSGVWNCNPGNMLRASMSFIPVPIPIWLN